LISEPVLLATPALFVFDCMLSLRFVLAKVLATSKTSHLVLAKVLATSKTLRLVLAKVLATSKTLHLVLAKVLAKKTAEKKTRSTPWAG
jgi:hypothetical protein